MKIWFFRNQKGWKTFLAGVFTLLLLPAAGGVSWAAPGAPQGALPESSAFLEKVRERLRDGDELQHLYTFRQTETRSQLDGQGQVKNSSEKVFEVFPHSSEELTYRRLISRDGQPLDPEEIERQDEKYRQHLAEASRSGAQGGESEAEKRRRLIEQAFGLFDFEMEGRQLLEGHPTIVFRFEPKPNVQVKNRELKMLHSCSGKAWISETDHELVGLEAKLVDTVSFGFGIGARFYKGTEISLKRRKWKDEIWVMQESRFRMAARFLLVKSLRLEILNEYSDYRSADVTTRVGFLTETVSGADDSSEGGGFQQ